MKDHHPLRRTILSFAAFPRSMFISKPTALAAHSHLRLGPLPAPLCSDTLHVINERQYSDRAPGHIRVVILSKSIYV